MITIIRIISALVCSCDLSEQPVVLDPVYSYRSFCYTILLLTSCSFSMYSRILVYLDTIPQDVVSTKFAQWVVNALQKLLFDYIFLLLIIKISRFSTKLRSQIFKLVSLKSSHLCFPALFLFPWCFIFHFTHVRRNSQSRVK